MKKNIVALLLVVLISLSIVSVVSYAVCNNNGVPEPAIGETVYNCPADFTTKRVCGNGVCNSNETAQNCPADCGTSANHAPVFNTSLTDSSYSIKEGQSLTFSVHANDADGNIVGYYATGLPSGSDFNEITGEFSWVPRSGTVESGDSKTFLINFRATDGKDTAVMPVSIIVSTASVATHYPQVTFTNDGPHKAGSVFVLKINVTDADDTDVEYRLDFDANGVWDTAWRKFTNNSDRYVEVSQIYNWATKAVVSVKDYEGYLVYATTSINIVTDGGGTQDANNAPVATDVVISPSEPDINSDLTCTYTFTDADSDAESGSTFKWYKNGIEQSGLDTKAISYEKTLAGEAWKCEVTPKDGKEFGASNMSAEVGIRAIPSNPSSGGGGGSSCSGSCGGGSGTYISPFGNVAIPVIQSLTDFTIHVPGNLAITEMTINVNENMYYIYMNITKATLPSGGVPAVSNSYQYVQVTDSGIDQSKIIRAFIMFKVEKSWLNENSFTPESVVLERYSDGAWQKLPTDVLNSDSDYVYYKSQTPGFSYFAIVGGETSVVRIGGQTTTQPTDGNAILPITGDVTQPEGTEAGFNFWIPIIVLIVIVFIVAIVLATRGRNKRRVPE
ncbi:MAG: PGF-pre-PGF domain-containing protein [Candidatus Aenigmatarchaeota archaeon]